DDLVDLGNSKFKDRFIFAGTLTRGSKPFTRTDDVVSYNGNNKDLKGKIGIESEIVYNKTGLDVFNPPGGIDIFATLAALKQGLESNDPTAIENSIDPLDKAIKQTLSNSAEFGILQNKLDLTVQIIEKEKINYADFMSKIQDTDIAETIVNYQMLENALNSGLKTMAEIVRTSLVDFIA
ncbi:MAG: flagellin, partial [bacterium]